MRDPEQQQSQVPTAEVDYIEHLRTMQQGEASEAAYQSARPYYEREVRPLLPADRQSRVVDIGSGYGHLLRFLLEEGFQRVGAVDSSQALLRDTARSLPGKLEFAHHGDGVEFLAKYPDSFDLITLFDVLEHIEPERHDTTMQHLFRALRPEGRVIVRVPNMANIFGVYSRYMDYTHRHGFTEFSLFQLFRSGGFADPRLHLPRPHGRWKHRLRQGASQWLQRQLLKADRRNLPRCLNKNLVVWSEREAA